MEGGLDLAEHRVERPPEAANLGPLVPLGDAVVEVSRGDLPGGQLNVIQRPQVGPDDGDRDDREDDHNAAADHEVEQDEPGDQRVNVPEVNGYHEGRGPGRLSGE